MIYAAGYPKINSKEAGLPRFMRQEDRRDDRFPAVSLFNPF